MFLKNFSRLVSTTFFVQAVSFLLYPLITRQWAPADFGEFSLVISVGNILSIFCSGQFHVGTMVQNDEEKSAALFDASKFICLCSVIIISLVVLIWAPSPQWYLLPPFIFFFTAYEIQRIKNTRENKIGPLTRSQIVARIGANLLKLIPGTSIFLVFSEVAGSLGGALMLTKGKIKDLFSFKKPSFQLLYEYKKYPIFYSLNLGTQALTFELPSILLGFQKETYLIGIYGMCQRLIIQPLTTVSNNAFTAFFSVPMSPQDRLKKSMRIGVSVVLIGIVLKVFFDLWGQEVLGHFLGSKWRSGKEIFTIFSFLLITKVLGNMALANYISTYRLERSTFLRLFQVICILVSYLIFKTDGLLFFKIFVGIDMTFDLVAFLISLRKN